MVGGADEAGPRRRCFEAERVGRLLERRELVRVPVADDRQMLLRGAQVLADRQHLHAVLAQHREGLDHLLVTLAEPDHQPRLRRHPRRRRAAWRSRVPRTERRNSDPRRASRIEPRDDLDVVVEDVWPGGDHARERHLLALEVRCQHLDLAAGRLAADLADHGDERGRAEIREIVAVDRGDHGVAQAHPRDCPCDSRRLERVVPGRLSRLDVAEAAAARAGVAEDHECRRPALPALADIRAGRLLADRVQVLGLDQALQPAVPGAAGRRHLEPRRLSPP